MKAKSDSEGKHCGNCCHHWVYHYPDEVLCMLHFKNRENHIVPTLYACESWRESYQNCFCVKEALKSRSSEAEPPK